MMLSTREGAKQWFGLELPRHVISIRKEYPHDEWIEYTTFDVLREKRERNEDDLKRKRRHPVLKPCIVWVFYNSGFPFGGWWIYIRTLKKYFGINFRGENDLNLVEKIMRLFPCGVLPVFENFRQWAERFSKMYPTKSFGGRKKQGLKYCVCKIDGFGRVKDVKIG